MKVVRIELILEVPEESWPDQKLTIDNYTDRLNSEFGGELLKITIRRVEDV